MLGLPRYAVGDWVLHGGMRHGADPRTLATPPRLDMLVKLNLKNQILLPRVVVSSMEVAE